MSPAKNRIFIKKILKKKIFNDGIFMNYICNFYQLKKINNNKKKIFNTLYDFLLISSKIIYSFPLINIK